MSVAVTGAFRLSAQTTRKLVPFPAEVGEDSAFATVLTSKSGAAARLLMALTGAPKMSARVEPGLLRKSCQTTTAQLPCVPTAAVPCPPKADEMATPLGSATEPSPSTRVP